MTTLAESEATDLRDKLVKQEALGGIWRKQAFVTYANYVMQEHVVPYQDWYTDSAIVARLNHLGIPVFRGPGPWTTDKLRGIRKAQPRHIRDLVDKRARRTVS